MTLFVPDDQMQTVCSAAAAMDLHPADEARMPCLGPYEEVEGAVRFHIRDRPYGLPPQRLVFVPLSWSGLRSSEVFPLDSKAPEIQFEPRTPDPFNPPPADVPGFVNTIPIAAACATLMRIGSREKRCSQLLDEIRLDLCHIVSYGLFDVSYEGAYRELLGNDVPLSEKELAEMDCAADDIRGWVFRSNEKWMQELLVQIVLGKAEYDDIPLRAREAGVGVLVTIDNNV